jgi:carboxypeptidase Taq
MSKNIARDCPKYYLLEKQIAKVSQLSNLAALVSWDCATMLRPGSAHARQEELATLHEIIHDLSTSDELGDLIQAAAANESLLDDWQKSNLKLIQRSFQESRAIAPEMKRELSIASSACEFMWRQCKANNDFKTLVPYLDRVFSASIAISKAVADKFDKSTYEILVQSFDPDRQISEIKQVYDVLKKELPVLIGQIIQKQSSQKVIKLTSSISQDTQKAIGLKVLEKMGFDLNRGRLDRSAHPFCTGSRSDTRITTRYDENNFLSSLLGVIHEAGHGLYQQNLPEKYTSQPVGAAKGMAFHESQSLIMEMQACSSYQFAEFLAKLLKDDFGFSSLEYSGDNLYKLMTRVRPSFIRVDADEVTYPLHVILRFDIEQEIVRRNIKAADLPEIWNNKMSQYLGIVPDSYAQGCLQDIHWPSGLLGYFPSYTNGAIIASMLMQSAIKQEASIYSQLVHGDFSALNKYLNNNLREYGSLKSSQELLLAATGKEKIDAVVFLDYLKQKYLND